MGSVFRRKDSRFWWIGFQTASGRRRLKSTGTEDEKEARRLLAAIERKVSAERELGVTDDGPLTVERYAKKWIATRRRRGVASVDDDEARLAHLLPRLGALRLDAVRRVDIRDFMRELAAEKKLAPRTQLHVYGVCRVMFADACTEDLIPATPCTLKQRLGDLPRKADKDPSWRATAVFTRSEVELLISHPRIPEFRRVLYAVEFLAGMRVNEIVPRRWRDYDGTTEPLGRLFVGSSYNIKKKLVKTPKNGFTREVPVHPTLAAVLAKWRLVGWERHLGRRPKEDDLIVPAENGELLSSTSALKRLHEHLQLLGLRERRQHDARRTFVSLGIADGARKEILRWVSHGPTGDIVDLYTTLPWATLCGEVSKLKIRLLEGKLLPLDAAEGIATVSYGDEGSMRND